MRASLLLLAGTLSLCACNVDKQEGASGEQRVMTPGGTDQADTINSSTMGDSPNAMPGVGAPGTAGAGTQPGTATDNAALAAGNGT